MVGPRRWLRCECSDVLGSSTRASVVTPLHRRAAGGTAPARAGPRLSGCPTSTSSAAVMTPTTSAAPGTSTARLVAAQPQQRRRDLHTRRRRPGRAGVERRVRTGSPGGFTSRRVAGWGPREEGGPDPRRLRRPYPELSRRKPRPRPRGQRFPRRPRWLRCEERQRRASKPPQPTGFRGLLRSHLSQRPGPRWLRCEEPPATSLEATAPVPRTASNGVHLSAVGPHAG